MTVSNAKPPASLEAEQALLGGILVDPEVMPEVVDVLNFNDFYRERHRQIYQCAVDLYSRETPVDLVTVTNAVKTKGVLDAVGGVAYLNELVDNMPTGVNMIHYAMIVKDKAALRQLIAVSEEIIEGAYTADVADICINEAEQKILKVAEAVYQSKAAAVGDMVGESLQHLEDIGQSEKAITGVATGFYSLDVLTSGFQKTDLVVVAARPGMGKTAFCMNVVWNAAYVEKVPIAVFSLEMSKEQLIMRMFSSISELPFSKLRVGAISADEWPLLVRTGAKLKEAPIYIDDTPAITIGDLRGKSRRLKKEKNIGLVVVDYLQLIKTVKGGKGYREVREQEVGEISRSLKALAKELDIPVIAISQLNRMVEQRDDKRPRLSDLRESGAIEQDADVIMFLYRDDRYNHDPANPKRGTAEVIIGKQRNGPTGQIDLQFDSKIITFRNLWNDDDEGGYVFED